MTRFILLLLAGFVWTSAVGCQQPTRPPNPTGIEAGAYDRTYDAAREVLRDAGFVLDRSDYRFGQVTTQPKDSPIVGEFWDDDNSTGYQAWQSTLSHVRRTVRVSLEPGGAADGATDDIGGDVTADRLGDYLVRVEVLMERRQMPTRRLTGSISRTMFATLDEVPAELAERGITASYWEPIGRDAYLERRLLGRILDHAAQ